MVSFVCQNSAAFKFRNKRKISSWLRSVAQSENKSLANIQYTFCDDEEILRLNKQYLNHDYYTDIITFDYSQEHDLHGEMFISTDTVATNASKLKVSFEAELHRVIVHGLLHLIGYNDKTKKLQLEMRAKEDFYLNELSKQLNV